MAKQDSILIRNFQETDFPFIHQLNEEEGWNGLAQNKEQTESAWNHSNVTLIAEHEGTVAGYLRGITDGYISLYICEMVIKQDFRGRGIGTSLLKTCHERYPKTRMEMLATSSSQTFYNNMGFRPFYGFRKTYEEWE